MQWCASLAQCAATENKPFRPAQVKYSCLHHLFSRLLPLLQGGGSRLPWLWQERQADQSESVGCQLCDTLSYVNG